MLSFWFKKEESNTAITEQFLVALIRTCIDNYWIFTDMALAGQDKSEAISKLFVFLGFLSRNILLHGCAGFLQDAACYQLRKNDDNRDGTWRWQNHIQSLGIGVLGTLTNSVINYWIFSKTPMTGDANTGDTAIFHKALYMLVEYFVDAELFFGLGNSVELNNKLKQLQAEAPLLQRGR